MEGGCFAALGAAEKENGVVEASLVLDTLEKSLGKVEDRKEGMDVFCVVETAGGVAISGPPGTLQCDLYQYVVEDRKEGMDVFCVVETAGGVAISSPPGTLQCDLYQNEPGLVRSVHFVAMNLALMWFAKIYKKYYYSPSSIHFFSIYVIRHFRLPGVLMGDGRLGGISGTISAYESLKLRGFDIVVDVLEDHGLVKEVPLLSYLRNRVPVIVLPPVPQDLSNDLVEWFGDSDETFNSLKQIMLSAFSERIRRLNYMIKKAGYILWRPFTQHKLVPEETVTVIIQDVARTLLFFRKNSEIELHDKKGRIYFVEAIYPAQTCTGRDCYCYYSRCGENSAVYKTKLAKDMGYTTVRYGLVMFPENAYEPALECAELLLEGVGKGWASRTYYLDNGSTSFHKFSFDNGLLLDLPNNNRTEKSIQLKQYLLIDDALYYKCSEVSLFIVEGKGLVIIGQQ
ncbi:bifunctional dethiobiotin synthetase/7,8-diamino-pelargonic acid aminotransferase [Populus alba x Populus x berolinensis]|nr:bifunctional dethiobiotin synthetase/7,8-diamino-pelargonic acid aminotransferase [Populus alba x Populus x berolinensis]